MSRFQRRRQFLRSLHRCTRCGEPAAAGAAWCPSCLGIQKAKRVILPNDSARSRRLNRLRQNRELLLHAIERIECEAGIR